MRDGQVQRDEGDVRHAGAGGGEGFVGGGAGSEEVVGGGQGREAVVDGGIRDEDRGAAESYGERGAIVVARGCRGGRGLMWLWEGGVHWTDLWYWVGDLGWYGRLEGVIESDDIVA